MRRDGAPDGKNANESNGAENASAPNGALSAEQVSALAAKREDKEDETQRPIGPLSGTRGQLSGPGDVIGGFFEIPPITTLDQRQLSSYYEESNFFNTVEKVTFRAFESNLSSGHTCSKVKGARVSQKPTLPQQTGMACRAARSMALTSLRRATKPADFMP